MNTIYFILFSLTYTWYYI